MPGIDHFLAGLAKLVGIKGIFYQIAGQEIAGLDGFYSQNFPQYADYSILLPQNPAQVCARITGQLGIPCLIADANDFAVSILATSPDQSENNSLYEKILADNPSGNGVQQTPLS